MRATAVKRGNVIEFRGALWKVLDTQHTSIGKRGGYVQVKMQRLEDGHIETERFSSATDMKKAFLESRKLQYLYNDGKSYIFMDPDSGEQYSLEHHKVSDALPYLGYNTEAEISFYEGEPVAVQLAASVVLEVASTDPAVRGDTVSAVTKPAELETGLVVKVPGHVNTGDRIKVDTRTGEFLGRA